MGVKEGKGKVNMFGLYDVWCTMFGVRCEKKINLDINKLQTLNFSLLKNLSIPTNNNENTTNTITKIPLFNKTLL